MLEIIFILFAEAIFWIVFELICHVVVLNILAVICLSYGLTWLVSALFFESIFNGYVFVIVLVSLSILRLSMFNEKSKSD